MKNVFWIIALSAITLSSAYAPVQRQQAPYVDVCEPFSEVKLNLDMLLIGPMTFSVSWFYSAPANVYAEIPMVPNANYYDYEWYLDGVFQQYSSYNHEFTFYGCGSHYLGVRALTPSGWTDFAYGYFYVDRCF